MLDALRDRLAESLGVTTSDIDRIALALAFAELNGGLPDGVQRVDARQHPVVLTSLAAVEAPLNAPLIANIARAQPDSRPVAALCGRGLAMLERTLHHCEDVLLTLQQVGPDGSFVEPDLWLSEWVNSETNQLVESEHHTTAERQILAQAAEAMPPGELAKLGGLNAKGERNAANLASARIPLREIREHLLQS